MTTWFVTRHPGARDWAERQGIAVHRLVEHLDPDQVTAGDLVLGTLPVNLVCDLNERGARYLHLVLPLPPSQRGQEITAARMEALGARLEEFRVSRVSASARPTTTTNPKGASHRN